MLYKKLTLFTKLWLCNGATLLYNCNDRIETDYYGKITTAQQYQIYSWTSKLISVNNYLHYNKFF